MRGWALEMMNRSIFITVRSGSTRLPGKCYLEIDGVPNIVRVINIAKKSKEANIAVLCTTQLPEDDRLCELAKENNILFHRGSVEDKLDRWLQAAKETETEFFVTLDADDLFADPGLIDQAIEQYNDTQADFIEAKGLVCGAFSYGLKAWAVKRVCDIKDTTDTEMIEAYFKDTGKFKCEVLKSVDPVFERPELRMTLDYREDFEFFTTVVKALGKDFTLYDVIAYLDAHPEVVQINQSLQAKFLANQKAKTKLVLK